MKKTFATRITALSAALAVIAGSAASCGSNKSETKDQSKTSQQLMAASYRAELVDTDVELKNVSDMKKLDDGRIFIAEYDDEKNAPSYFIADAELTTFDEIKVDLGVELDDDTAVNSELAPDGNIKTLVTFTDFGDAEKPNLDDPDFDPEKFDFEEYYSNAKRTYKLYTVDLSGKVVSETEIKGLEKFEDDEEMGDMGGINEFYPCANGKIIISKYGSMGQQFIAINEDGTAGDEITVSGMSFIESMSPMDDGTIAVSGYSTTGSATKFIDGETFKETGSELKLSDIGNNGAGTLFPGNDTYKYFASSSSGVFGISEDGKSTELLNWLDSDMGDGYVSSFIPLENDDFIVWYDSYTESGDESGLYRLTKRDASELENTKVITVGVLYDNWEVKEKISAFNKAHDGVRFKMTDYSKFDEYDENGMVLSSGESELKKDIVSGKAPDMIVSYNRGIVESLNSKGLFIDLYDYINNDPDIKKDDILPNVLKALEKDGKLPCIAPTFYIDTLAAKGSRVNKPNWTVDDMLAEYDKLSEGSQLTQFDCKEMILMMVLSSLSDAIDYSNGTCNFDTPDFRKLIEFCDKFPAQKDIVDFEDQAAMMEFQKSMQDKSIKNNTILCSDITLDNFEDYTRQLRGDFENDMVFVGYPSSDGRGSLIDFNNNFAILTNSENKDECWELIKEFFKYPADDEDEGYMYGFPILKSEFDKLAEKSTKVPTYKDENGKEVEDPIMFYTDDGKEIKVDPLTNEEKDKLVEFITSVEKPGASIDPDVEMILQEEIMAFLGGEKTADEVINLIQSRVSTLVSEQS